MGFSAIQAENALRMTGNESSETAMQWLFEHIEDEDINVPFQQGSTGSSGGEVDAEKMGDLMGMGFEEHVARRALQETVLTPLLPPDPRFCAVSFWRLMWGL
jgi:ubiquitin carboxyl-terminal hydrolase 5/13